MQQDVGVEGQLELSVVMPCLNEEKTVGICVEKALNCMRQNGIRGEVIIADNGSTDASKEVAECAGARVVHVSAKGYGNALKGGIDAATGIFIIMGDCDDSYDFTNLMPFVEKLREGFDLVMGNRFRGGVLPGAMPPLHRYLGNPVLSFIGRLFFNTNIRDFHCGLRGFRKQRIVDLNLQTTGMEFASEVVVKACLHNLRVTEVPTTLSPDGRDRPPHLRSWRDGWRHLRFLLMYSPRWLFLYPGVIMLFVGLVIGGLVMLDEVVIFGIVFDIHTLVYCAALINMGFMSIMFAIMTRVFAYFSGLIPRKPSMFGVFSRFATLEAGLFTGILLLVLGGSGALTSLYMWNNTGLGPILNPASTMRVVVPSMIALSVGYQLLLGSFLISILAIQRNANPRVE